MDQQRTFNRIACLNNEHEYTRLSGPATISNKYIVVNVSLFIAFKQPRGSTLSFMVAKYLQSLSLLITICIQMSLTLIHNLEKHHCYEEYCFQDEVIVTKQQ